MRFDRKITVWKILPLVTFISLIVGSTISLTMVMELFQAMVKVWDIRM